MVELAIRRTIEVPQADWLAPQPPLARFVFRGDEAARAAASAAFGATIADRACRANAGGLRTALWLGPDENLLLAPDGEGPALRVALADALAGLAHSLVDVSHRQVAFTVQGPRAEWLLESQCPLPLNLRDFPVGACTRTVFAKAEIVLWRTSGEAFHVEVWRSFAPYVVTLLREVAME